MLTRQNYLGWRWSAVGRHSFKARRLSLGHRQSFFLQNKAQQQSVRDNHSAVAPSLQSASIETSFNAATIFWAQGLGSPPGHVLPWSHWSRPHGPDARVQRITLNLLQRASRFRSHRL